MIKKLTVTFVAAAALLFTGSIGMAQEDLGENPALQALASFANLLDPALLAELQAQYGSEDALAEALLQSLQARGVIDEETAAGMRTAIANRVLPRDTLIIFLADVANGTQPLTTRNIEELEVELAVVNNVRVPRGDANGNLAASEVAEVVTEVATGGGGGILDEIAASYDNAITPRNAEEAGA